ncbi:unnamed protein product [Miscanthus lutarioriparius]|uniref:PGG domain-containing protein n=1 Tax=Miscanthus lutarioriparius TaxID=422564 RepID=A0A811Q7X0_9POAL|nr:unnamed protein product [Miscanthus lutarioriparius]
MVLNHFLLLHLVSAIVRRIMEMRPWLARQESEDKYTPMHLAAYQNKVDVLTVLLEHDPFLGYLISTYGFPLLCIAASKGHVGVARELLKHCPDAPYCDANGLTCLHVAVLNGQAEFVEYVLGSQQLHHPINMADNSGESALHLARRRGLTWIASVLGDGEKNINNNPILLSMTLICRSKQWFAKYYFLQYIGHYSEGGYRKLALELIEAEPALSKAVTKRYESTMFIAVTRDYGDVLEKLLQIPDAAHGGAYGYNALHAAVTSGNAGHYRIRLVCRWPAAIGEVWIAIGKGFADGNPTWPSAKSHRQTFLRQREVQEQAVELPVVERRSRQEAPAFPGSGPGSVGTGPPTVSGSAATICPQLGHLYPVSCLGFVSVMAKRVMEARPWLVRQGNEEKRTPMYLAAIENKIDVLRVLLEHDPSLGYFISTDGDGAPLLCIAASEGNVGVARELLRHCRDPPYFDAMGSTCLRIAISFGQEDFVRNEAPVSACSGCAWNHSSGEHIAAIHGHEVFCKEVQALNPSLLTAINSDGETPLLAAVASGCLSVASVLLRCCRDQQLSGAILKQDKHGCNALHHAIRNGHRKLALELIQAEPALSHYVNQYGESPMFIAVMRKYEGVFDKLFEIRDSAHEGADGMNALHASVWNGNSGYQVSTLGNPLLVSAAYRGHVDVARELLKHCPDAPCYNTRGSTCLHIAVQSQQTEFVKFVLGLPQLQKLVNMRDENGDTALHVAVQKCDPKVAALLLHRDIDIAVVNNNGYPVNRTLPTDRAKTLNWNEVSMRMLKADPQSAPSIFNLLKDAKDEVTNLSRKDIMSLTQTYTGNTSVVAILIATITFAAAFTLPGGYSTDAGNEGLPIMAIRHS